MKTNELQQEAPALRVMICGAPGAGKSSLLARLLRESVAPAGHDTHSPDALREPAEGLIEKIPSAAERVGYRVFGTERRAIAAFDVPGQPQHAWEFANAAYTADCAVLAVDARAGLRDETKQQWRILKTLGVPHIVFAVNMMDLVAWDRAAYDAINTACAAFAQQVGFQPVDCVPVSAATGDNIAAKSTRSSWYEGRSLIVILERLPIGEPDGRAFRMAVQAVSGERPQTTLLHGKISAGRVSAGDRVRVIPSGIELTVESLAGGDTSSTAAYAGQSVALGFAGEVKAGIGEVLCAQAEPIEAADQFEAECLWFSQHALTPGRVYTARIHHQEAGATVTHIKHRIDTDSGARLAAKSLAAGEIGVVNVSFDRVVAFEPYATNRELGAFVLVDRLTNEIAGAGVIHFALRRAANIHWQAIDVNTEARASMKGQQARCIWFTGLSGSGKSTIANMLDKRLHATGRHTFVLDGDNVRHGLNRDLGFTEADRAENIRRVAEVARLMVDAGLIVLVSFISPYKAERAFARNLFRSGQFVEVFVDTPIDVCEQRDTKGLYAKARAGKLPNFTGFDSPYEAPESPEVVIKTVECSATDAAERLAQVLSKDFLAERMKQ